MMFWRSFFHDLIRKHFPSRKATREYGRSGHRREKDLLGIAGEKQAACFLKSLGYQIVGKRIAYDDGELDIIARDGETLVFVEVKTRRPHPTIHPSLSVNKKKRQKIKTLSFRYMKQEGLMPQIRFDVITVTWPENEEPRIEHFVDAFR